MYLGISVYYFVKNAIKVHWPRIKSTCRNPIASEVVTNVFNKHPNLVKTPPPPKKKKKKKEHMIK